MSDFQLFPDLDAATEAALTESIRRFGVLVPVAQDQDGRILDGYHRSRIAAALGVRFRVDVHEVADADEAREIAHTLNADRRQLSAEQRRTVVAVLREQGHSLRAIAGAVGADQRTVQRDLSTAADAAVPDRVVGLDGKSRPARRTVVAAKSQAEASRAQAALATLDESSTLGVIDTKRVERIAREAQATRRRSDHVETASVADDITIIHGDFTEVIDWSDVEDAVVISDPPYPREFLPAWVELADVTVRSPGIRRLVLMSGQTILPDVLNIISRARHVVDEHLTVEWKYRWCGAYLMPGPATRVWGSSVGCSWKPVLVFESSINDDHHFLTSDVFRSAGDDKSHHHWGQNEQGIAQLVEAFTNPGDIVIDPFLGGGTTAVVCRDLGRRFLGCDIDTAAITATRERLAT